MSDQTPEPEQDEISARMHAVGDGGVTFTAEFGGAKITLEVPGGAGADKAETLLTFFPSVINQLVEAGEAQAGGLGSGGVGG
jgi:hypothetical protein